MQDESTMISPDGVRLHRCEELVIEYDSEGWPHQRTVVK